MAKDPETMVDEMTKNSQKLIEPLPKEFVKKKVIGFIVKEQRGVKFEGQIPLDRFEDFLIDNKQVSFNEIMRIG